MTFDEWWESRTWAGDESLRIVAAAAWRAAQEALEAQNSTSTNTSSPKLPDIEECYKKIPFPEDERESAFFCAGLAEMYKFIAGKIGR